MSLPWLVKAPRSPYNLRPALDMIMRAENFILERIPADQKLVILMGEHHLRDTHNILQKAVLERHAEIFADQPDRPFAFGYELPHNFRHKAYHKNSAAAQEELIMDDDEGGRSMEAFLSSDVPLSTEARWDVFSTCIYSNISVSFNDVSFGLKSKNPVIDQNDDFTASLVQAHMPEMAGKKLYALSDKRDGYKGFHLRNIGIVTNATNHIHRSDARIYIQQCGLSHVLGWGELKFKDSLTAKFTEKGYTVLPVLPDVDRLVFKLPGDAMDALEHSVILEPGRKQPPFDIPYDDLFKAVRSASKFDFHSDLSF